MVGIDDGTANCQSHAHSVLFRRKEGFENSVWILHASAGIPHLDQDRFRAGPFGTNEEFLGTIHDGVHCLDPIEKQIENVSQIKTWAETIKGNGDKIADRASKMQEALQKQVEELDQQLGAIKTTKTGV